MTLTGISVAACAIFGVGLEPDDIAQALLGQLGIGVRFVGGRTGIDNADDRRRFVQYFAETEHAQFIVLNSPSFGVLSHRDPTGKTAISAAVPHPGALAGLIPRPEPVTDRPCASSVPPAIWRKTAACRAPTAAATRRDALRRWGRMCGIAGFLDASRSATADEAVVRTRA